MVYGLAGYFSSATNRLITAKDHASVQINIGHLDDRGVYTGTSTTFALSGFIRAQVGVQNNYVLSSFSCLFDLFAISRS